MFMNINAQKLYAAIGQKLRRIRLEHNLLQVDVAEMTGFSSHYISRIEIGKARITYKVLEKLVKGLKIHSSDLLEF